MKLSHDEKLAKLFLYIYREELAATLAEKLTGTEILVLINALDNLHLRACASAYEGAAQLLRDGTKASALETIRQRADAYRARADASL